MDNIATKDYDEWAKTKKENTQRKNGKVQKRNQTEIWNQINFQKEIEFLTHLRRKEERLAGHCTSQWRIWWNAGPTV